MNGNMRFARIMGQLVNVPLFAHPRTAITVYNALCGRFGTAPAGMPDTPDASLIDGRWQGRDAESVHEAASLTRHNIRASRFEGERVQNAGGGFPRVEPFMRTPEGVGIITVDGELVNRGAWVGSDSGTVSYEGLKFQLTRAAKDPGTKAILMDLNTPGGEAVGVDEVAALVRSVREVKPVYAIANGMAASAGYAIASGATRVFNAPSGLAGSIGCVLMHLDMSGALEQKGISPTLIYAGAHKVDGNSTGPLGDDVKAQLQAEVDSFYQQFLGTVAAGRGRRLSIKAARETEARTYMGAAAVEAGLADAVGTFDEVLAETTSKIRRSGSKASATRSQSMSRLGIDDSQEQDHSAAVNSARDEGHKAGVAEGTKAGQTAANARMAAILSDERVKGREVHAVKLACKSPDMTQEDVCAFVAELPVAAAAAPSTVRGSISERVEETGVNGVQSGQAGSPAGGPQIDSEAQSVASSWGAAMAPVVAQRQHARRS